MKRRLSAYLYPGVSLATAHLQPLPSGLAKRTRKEDEQHEEQEQTRGKKKKNKNKNKNKSEDAVKHLQNPSFQWWA